MHLYLNMDIFVPHPSRPFTKCSLDETAGDEVSPRRNGWRRSVPATKCQAAKCPRDGIAGDEVSPRRNARRQSVLATEWLATKCPRDEMAGDETTETKRRRRKSGHEKGCTRTRSYTTDLIARLSCKIFFMLTHIDRLINVSTVQCNRCTKKPFLEC